jgi:hypothetical protein
MHRTNLVIGGIDGCFAGDDNHSYYEVRGAFMYCFACDKSVEGEHYIDASLGKSYCKLHFGWVNWPRGF